MRVKLIKTSGDFLRKYIQINNGVYSLSDAPVVYPDWRKHLKEEAFAGQEVVQKFVYPSATRMQVEIEKSAGEIISKLKLTPPKNAIEHFYTTSKLFYYFGCDLNYNMLSQEERGANMEDDADYFRMLKQNRQKLEDFNLKVHYPKTSTMYKLGKSLVYNQMSTKIAQLKSGLKDASLSHIKGLYNVFVRKIGVCSDFTRAFNYVLQKLDINTYKVLVEQEVRGRKIFHMYSLVEVDTTKGKQYYFCDLTKIVSQEKGYILKNLSEGKLLGFGLGQESKKRFNDKTLSIQKSEPGVGNEFVFYLEDKVMPDNIGSSLIYRLMGLGALTNIIIMQKIEL